MFELGVSGLVFRVWGLGFGVWGLGFRVWGFGFRGRSKNHTRDPTTTQGTFP